MRDADHGGCADRAEIPAVERCRIGHAQQEQLARFEAAAKLQGRQRPAQSVGRQRGGRRYAVDAYLTGDDANMLRRDCAHTFEQRNAGRQVAALRGQHGGLGGQRHQHDAVHEQRTWQRGGARVERVYAIPADRHAVGRVVGQTRQRRHEGRPGQRSEADGGQCCHDDASTQARART